MLLAVAELWAEAGYEELSIEAVCGRAGVDAETFRSIFPDLEAAAEATLEAPIGMVVGLVAEQYTQDRSEPESCAMGIAAILELMAANPAFAHVIYIGRRQAVPPGASSAARSAQRLIVAMLERLRESSGIGGQPLTAGAGALGAPEAVIRREVLAGRLQRLPSLAFDVVYAATVPFVGQAEALRLARLGRERIESRRQAGESVAGDLSS